MPTYQMRKMEMNDCPTIGVGWFFAWHVCQEVLCMDQKASRGEIGCIKSELHSEYG